MLSLEEQSAPDAPDVSASEGDQRDAEQPATARLSERDAFILEARLDDLEATGEFSPDEIDALYRFVYPEGAPPARPAFVTLGARAQDKIAHLIDVAKKSTDGVVSYRLWRGAMDEARRVYVDPDKAAVSPQLIAALEGVLAHCRARPAFVCNATQLEAALYGLLPEKYLGPALLAELPSADAPVGPGREGRIEEYARRLHQRCLWHPDDFGNREVELEPDAPAEQCQTGCVYHSKKKAHARKARSYGEKVEADVAARGVMATLPGWFPGMFRMEDAHAQEEPGYNAALYRDSGRGACKEAG